MKISISCEDYKNHKKDESSAKCTCVKRNRNYIRELHYYFHAIGTTAKEVKEFNEQVNKKPARKK